MMMDVDLAMRPPAYDAADDAASRPSILLDKFAYFSDRRNATTASCDMRGPKLKGRIQVTFCPTRPPKVSYFCVHTTDFDPSDFAIEPKILATDGPLALIRVVIGLSSALFRPSQREYFIYHAGNPSEGKDPWLKHLPHPTPYIIGEPTLAIVRHCSRASTLRRHSDPSGGSSLPPHGVSQEDHDCSDCNYAIVALQRGGKTGFQLCMCHSENDCWCVLPMPAMAGGRTYASHLGNASKTINIGGGTVAWVDHSLGIIFCNVLAVSASSPPQFRCLSLPPRITATKGRNTASIGDIVAMNGFVAYTELQVPIVDPDLPMDDGTLSWKAAQWSIKTPDFLAAKSSWQKDCELDSADVSCELQVGDNSLPALKRLHIGLPSMSLQDDGFVYIPAKINPEDKHGEAWVLVVDMKRKTLQEVAEFCTPRGVNLAEGRLFTSRISKYLQVTPGTERKSKRQKMLLPGSSNNQQPEISMAADVPLLPVEPQSEQELEVEVASKGAECSEDMVLEFFPVETQSQQETEVGWVSNVGEFSEDMTLELAKSQQETEVAWVSNVGEFSEDMILELTKSQQETEVAWVSKGAEFGAIRGAEVWLNARFLPGPPQTHEETEMEDDMVCW